MRSSAVNNVIFVKYIFCMCIYNCATIWSDVCVEAWDILNDCRIWSNYKCRYMLFEISSKILQLFNCFDIVPPEDYWNSFLKNEYTFYMKLLRIQFFYKKHIFTYHQCHVNCEFFSNEVVNKENKSHKYVSSYFYSLWYIYTLKTYKKCSLKY